MVKSHYIIHDEGMIVCDIAVFIFDLLLLAL